MCAPRGASPASVESNQNLLQIMLPGSIFATAGARAMGDAGRMPHGHKEVAGLQIAYVARDALTARHRSSCNKMLVLIGQCLSPSSSPMAKEDPFDPARMRTLAPPEPSLGAPTPSPWLGV
jgi:hypothetical protein